MIDDGVAASMSVVLQRIGTNCLSISIVLTEPVKNTEHPFQYSLYWNHVGL